MKKLFILLSLLSAFSITRAQGEFFSAADAFFRAYVNGEGKVNYAGLKEHPADLDTVMAFVAKFKLAGADSAVAEAYWINAYNLCVINQVVQHYPLKSVNEVQGFFTAKTNLAAGQLLSLNEIEYKALHAGSPTEEAGKHFVLVCGAESCPRLGNAAVFPDRVDEQISERTRVALNDPAFIRYNPLTRELAVSQIFQWYGSAFAPGAEGLTGFINPYRSLPLPSGTRVDFYPYDWKLNDGSNAAPKPNVYKEGNAGLADTARHDSSPAIVKPVKQQAVKQN